MLKLSVVISTFNRCEGLRRTLNSLQAQDLDASLWDIVVVDNNSQDLTVEVCKEFSNVTYVFESQQGLSFARNTGIAHARGEYIVMVDDDEIFVEGFLSAYFNLFESEPDALLAGGRVEPLYEFDKPAWLGGICERAIAGTVNFSSHTKFFPSTRYPTGGNMAFRACVFREYGGFNTELGRKGSSLMGGEEKDFFERVNAKIYYIYDALMYHIIPQNRATKEYIYSVASMIGRSERLRTQQRGIYVARLFGEMIKWAGTLVYSLGYILQGRFSSAHILCGLRLRISRALIARR